MPERTEFQTVDAGPPTQPSLDAMPDPFDRPGGREPAPYARPSTDAYPPTLPFVRLADGADAITPAAPEPVAVPAQYHYLKRWTFVLVLIGVWVPAAAAGLGLYYLWFTSVDKTMPVFLLLVFVAVCAVTGVLLSTVEGKPLVTAVAFALLSATGAATAAAAFLHGAYFFQWIDRPG